MVAPHRLECLSFAQPMELGTDLPQRDKTFQKTKHTKPHAGRAGKLSRAQPLAPGTSLLQKASALSPDLLFLIFRPSCLRPPVPSRSLCLSVSLWSRPRVARQGDCE